MCVLEVLFPLKALVRCTLPTVWTVVIILKKKASNQIMNTPTLKGASLNSQFCMVC